MQTTRLPPGKNRNVRFLFIDDDPRCINMLNAELKRNSPDPPRPGIIEPPIVRKGTCAAEMESALTTIGAWGMPILAVLDSFGNVPIPNRLIRRLAANVSTEVIITFMPEHFIRFVNELGPEIDDLFGGNTSWREVAQQPDGPQKRRFLLGLYRGMLVDSGFKYLLDFEMIDKRGRSLYLIFATNSPLGVSKMKACVWEVDQSYGVRFRDPRDEQDEALFLLDDPQDAPLQRLILSRLNRTPGKGVRVTDLREFALMETVYREAHVIPALQRLREKHQVEVAPNGRIFTTSWARVPERLCAAGTSVS